MIISSSGCTNQDEIIVLPGTYKCSFINNTIPFDKSYLLQKEDDINALSRLSDFFIHNKNDFVINKIDIIKTCQMWLTQWHLPKYE
jgi:hypothetical protein